MKIFEVDGNLKVDWNTDAKAIIDTWTSYSITLEGFKNCIDQGINHSIANRGIAWIIDSRKAEGQFSEEIQHYIVSDVLPKFAKNGIKYFMIIDSFDAETNSTINYFAEKANEFGIKVIKGSSVKGALNWLVKNVRQT